MPLKHVDINDYSPGLITNVSPGAGPRGSAALIENYDLSESNGALKRRRGMDRIVAPQNPHETSPGRGLGEFISASGTQFYVWATQTVDWAYNVTTGSAVSPAPALIAGPSIQVRYATFGDLLIAVGSESATRKWTGSGVAGVLLGTPPSNANFIEVHKRRVWIAHTSAGASRLHYSAIDNAEDWTTANNSGYIDIDDDDSDVITGLASIGEVLFVFKNRSIHMISGYDVPFTVNKVSSSIGCIASNTIVKTEGFAIFLSGEGIFSISADKLSLLSFNVKPTVDSIISDARVSVGGTGHKYSGYENTTTCAGRLRQQYWLRSETGDRCLVLDYVTGAFWEYTGIKSRNLLTTRAGKLIGTVDSHSSLMQYDTGTQDDDVNTGTPADFTAKWKSNEEMFESFSSEKNFQNLTLFTSTTGSPSATITVIVDGVTDSDTITHDTTTDQAAGRSFSIQTHNFEQNHHGKLMQIQVAQTTGTAMDIYGHSILADVLPRD